MGLTMTTVDYANFNLDAHMLAFKTRLHGIPPQYHPKDKREIINRSTTQNDAGDALFICPYTGKAVTWEDAVVYGALIPRLHACEVGHPNGREAYKQSKRDFDAMDRNCNTCQKFNRLPHENEPNRFLKGRCGEMPAGNLQAYRHVDDVFWIHSDDWMGMDCWAARPVKVQQ